MLCCVEDILVDAISQVIHHFSRHVNICYLTFDLNLIPILAWFQEVNCDVAAANTQISDFMLTWIHKAIYQQ